MSKLFEIIPNVSRGSIEIKFSKKPCVAIRDALKQMRFKWNPKTMLWYGFREAEEVEKTLNALEIGEQPTILEVKKEKKAKPKPKLKKNALGVQVGDIFSASWGYDQTNVDFFQIIELVGEQSARVREVCPMMTEEKPGFMSADRTYELNREILPAKGYSVFIKDQEKGDLKRIQGEPGHVYIHLSSFADATLQQPGKMKCYESWYA